MKTTKIIFCENRNSFYKETVNGITRWTKKNEDAQKFNLIDSNEFVKTLKESLSDSKYINAVDINFERIED